MVVMRLTIAVVVAAAIVMAIVVKVVERHGACVGLFTAMETASASDGEDDETC